MPFFGWVFCKIAGLTLLFKNLRNGLNLVVFEAFPLSLCDMFTFCNVLFSRGWNLWFLFFFLPMERILRSSSLLSSINNQTLLCCEAHVCSFFYFLFLYQNYLYCFSTFCFFSFFLLFFYSLRMAIALAFYLPIWLENTIKISLPVNKQLLNK